MSKAFRAGVTGTGSCVPSGVLTNADMERMVDTSDEWIQTRTGIRERRQADENTASSDLALEAAQRALADAGRAPEDVDLIVLATVTPDYFLPATACLVQDRLGAKNAGAFDVNTACPGFVTAMAIGQQFVETGSAKCVLAIGAEVLTKFVNYEDRTSCILFGDGAGAAVIEPTNGRRELLYSKLGADGSGAEMMMTPAGGSRHPLSHEAIDQKQDKIVVRGREVFKFAVTKMQDCIAEALEACDLTADQIGLIVPHQVNLRILKSAADRFGLPMEKIFLNIEKYGNTGGASGAVALDEAVKQGRIHDGDYVIVVAFGGGLSWGACVIRW